MRVNLQVLVSLIVVMSHGIGSSVAILAANIQAKVFSVQGDVQYALPQSKEFKPLEKDLSLPVGSTIRSGEGQAVIVTTPGTAINVDRQTRLVLDDLAVQERSGKITQRTARIHLRSGTVSALIDKDARYTDFRIKTPQGVATARGTFFAISTQGDRSYMGVKEGKVRTAVPQSKRYKKI